MTKEVAVKVTSPGPKEPKKAIPQAPDAAKGPDEAEVKAALEHKAALHELSDHKKDEAKAHVEEMNKLAEEYEKELAKAAEKEHA